MNDFTILEELKTLLPPLSGEEFTGLETAIKRDGCLTPLVLWNNILIDGHHRYAICKKHKIPFQVTTVVLESLDEAKLWIGRNQNNRRNMAPYQRGELALKLKESVSAKAKERQRLSGGPGKKGPTNSTDLSPKETRQELAEIARVAPSTLGRIEYIAEHADDETKEKLRKGDKETTINKVFKSLKARAEANDKTKSKASQAKGRTSKKSTILPTTNGKGIDIGPSIDSTTGKRVPTVQLNPIPHDRPEILAAGLMDHFSTDFAERVVLILVQMIRQKHGEKRSASLAEQVRNAAVQQ